MKANYIERDAALEVGGKRAALSGKAVIAHDADGSFEAAGDRQIDEIERTFTLRYEW